MGVRVGVENLFLDQLIGIDDTNTFQLNKENREKSVISKLSKKFSPQFRIVLYSDWKPDR